MLYKLEPRILRGTMLHRLNPAYIQALQEAPLFADFTLEEVNNLGRFCCYQVLPPRTALFQQAEACSNFYLLLSGFVELYLEYDQQHRKTVEFIAPGQTFAEAAMFSGQGYPVSAMTLQESELLAINSMKFIQFLKNRPQLNWRLLSNLSRRLHQLVGQIAALSLLNAEQRVIAYLLEHCNEERDCSVSHLPHRRAELASRLGLSMETLCRVLSQLKKQDLIETQQSQIKLLQPQALRKRLYEPLKA